MIISAILACLAFAGASFAQQGSGVDPKIRERIDAPSDPLPGDQVPGNSLGVQSDSDI